MKKSPKPIKESHEQAARVRFLPGVSADKSALMRRALNRRDTFHLLLFHIVEKFYLTTVTLKLLLLAVEGNEN